MDFKKFAPGACKLEPHKVSALPTLSFGSLNLSRQGRAVDAAPWRRRAYMRSRYALTDAYRLCGVGKDGALLAPAYHCRTMLDPALRLGAECRFYPLPADLSVNVDVVDAILAHARGRISAVLATHFFGFVQDFRALAECCRRHGVYLIEDCSHLLSTLGKETVVGSVGRYSVWSPYKFFPCEDGGTLQVNADAPMPENALIRQSPRDEIRGLVHLLRRSRRQIKATDVSALAGQLTGDYEGRNCRGVDLDESTCQPSADYHTRQESSAMSRVSRWLVQHADVARIKQRRRQRYLEWQLAAEQWPHCKPLHSELPDDCIPYMFPLYVSRPDLHLMSLKRIGVPIWRWDSMAVSDCPVASDYRLHIFHMPCHQELNDAEMRWMLEAVASVLASEPS